MVTLNSCVSRKQVEADLWSHEQLPAALCDRVPELWNYGIFRVVECRPGSTVPECLRGDKTYQEYKPYCDKAIKNTVAMTKADLEKWFKLLFPEEKKKR